MIQIASRSIELGAVWIRIGSTQNQHPTFIKRSRYALDAERIGSAPQTKSQQSDACILLREYHGSSIVAAAFAVGSLNILHRLWNEVWNILADIRSGQTSATKEGEY